MTTSVNQGTNRTIFSDGCGLTSTDLSMIGINATKRAWEEPAHGNLLSLDLAIAGGYDSTFAGASTALQSGVFTVNGGLVASSSGLVSSLGAGHAGLWDETRLSPPNASDAAPRMSWVWTYQDWVHTHAAASSGNTRYDLVHCAIVKSNLSATRDFKDATTGAKTSETMVTAEQLALDIQVTSGTQSTGTPTIPSLPSGRHALYAVLVNSTTILEVDDFVIPVGPLVTGESILPSFPGLGTAFPAWSQSDFSTGYLTVASVSAGPYYVAPPHGILGNPNARIIGVSISHELQSGDSVKLVRLAAGSTESNLLTLSMTTMDSQVHSQFIDLRGFPNGGKPYWGHGRNDRTNPAPGHSFCALKFTAAGTGSFVRGVTWYAIQG
jgi:hypothetical protein